MKQIIELKDTGKRKMIADFFNISLPNLSQILRYQRNGPNADAVRKMAEEHGGVRMVEQCSSTTIRILDSKGETKRVITSQKDKEEIAIKHKE